MRKRKAARTGSIAARMVLRVVELTAARGHDAEALCRSVGLSLAVLREPGARLPYALAERLGERATELTRDPNIGLHLAQDVRSPGQVDAGMLMLMASANVRSALERMVRYQRFWGDGERSKLVTLRGGVAVRYLLPGSSGVTQRHNDECAMAEIVLGLTTLAVERVIPKIVRFRHVAPRDRREHQALFACPLEFSAAHTEVVFDEATLAIAMRHAHDFYAEIFRQQVERAIANLPAERVLSQEVRAIARAELAGGGCTLTTTARALGMTARTLQRRLQAEDSSFDALIDALRRELALAYLDRRLAVREIATLLGYGDPRAFHHAFKRWTGLSPEQARAARTTERTRPAREA
jgi:AraC-like DNA-binding protein